MQTIAIDLDPVLAMPVYADLFARFVPGYGWVWPAKGLVYRVENLPAEKLTTWWYRRTGRIA